MPTTSPTTPAPSTTATRELDHRVGDGLEVRLLWEPATDRVSIALHDLRRDESLAFEVPASEALDAFRHPYIHAPVLNRARLIGTV